MLGVYVHVPFCARRCPYCDFDIAVRRQPPHVAYRDAVLSELAARGPGYDGLPVATLYFGGGTPSLWDPDCLLAVLRAVVERYGVPREVTVEANPEHVTTAWLEQMRRGGVTRLSLGVQSFQPAALRQLGRRHDAEQAIAAVRGAFAVGFDDVNVDLIFGHRGGEGADSSHADSRAAPRGAPAQGQSVAEYQRDLDMVVALGVPHVSAYGLTIEPTTRFGRWEAAGRPVSAAADRQAELFAWTESALAAHGFARYEVSNLARDGRWGLHNVLTWLGGQYLGLGLGAHSLHRDVGGQGVRRANSRDLRRYLATPLDALGFEERLSREVHLAERLFVGLRTRFPVLLEPLRACHSEAALALYMPVLERLQEQALVRLSATDVTATTRGLRYQNAVAQAIVDAMPEAV